MRTRTAVTAVTVLGRGRKVGMLYMMAGLIGDLMMKERQKTRTMMQHHQLQAADPHGGGGSGGGVRNVCCL